MSKRPGIQTSSNVDASDETNRVAEGVTPWDILAYIGESYERLKQIRTTLYQMRHNLLVLSTNQSSALRGVLLNAIPMTVYTVVESLEVLAKIDNDLLPRSQVHRKTLSKWEMYRDDSAHFALRAFLVATKRHELKQFVDGALSGRAIFFYDFTSDQFCAGDDDLRRRSTQLITVRVG